jgi:hypothetical protein
MKEKTFINFTKATLTNLPIPQKGLLTFCDTQEKGLSLYVTPAGHKSFMVRKRINRKNTRMVLGTFPDMTVDMARNHWGTNPPNPPQSMPGYQMIPSVPLQRRHSIGP